MDRAQQKIELFVKLGALFGPLQKIIKNPEQYDDQENAEALARFCAEFPILQNDFASFSKGQLGHDYAVQNHIFRTALFSVHLSLVTGKSLEFAIADAFPKAKAAIAAIPIPKTSVILEAGSPFSAYLRLHSLCAGDAMASLTWIDPYFDATVFRRYVSHVQTNVAITLVTIEATRPNSRDGKRWSEFLDISKLFAQERGSTGYRLIVQATLHDRWVIFDDKRIYSLGGSAKDAADRDYFTIAAIDASVSNFQKIQTVISSGAEFFGPNCPTHR